MGVDFIKKERYSIDDLLEIMSFLRSENGCPWDREQTHDSIRKNFIEETYEAVEAIDCNDPGMLREELGDVLLQVVFHTQMEKEKGNFDFDDVCDGICKKLVVRHPHIFGEEEIRDAEDVHKRWEEIKKITKGQKTGSETLQAVPKQLPALMRCEKLLQRAKRSGGFRIETEDVFDMLEKKASGFREVACSKEKTCSGEELGELLFLAVCAAEKLDLDAEECLTQTSEKFIKRFSAAENSACAEGKTLSELKDEEFSLLWKKAEEETN